MMKEYRAQYGSGDNYRNSKARPTRDPNTVAYVRDLRDERLARELVGRVVAYDKGNIELCVD